MTVARFLTTLVQVVYTGLAIGLIYATVRLDHAQRSQEAGDK